MRKDIIKRKEQILQWIKESRSKAFICKELTCKPITLEGYLTGWGIKYKGNQGGVGYKVFIKMSAEDYSKSNYAKSHVLRLKLIEEGIKEHKCERCGNNEWEGEKIPLELHHIDGNRFNNNINNVQILCPNCHALTPNYGSRNSNKIVSNKYICSGDSCTVRIGIKNKSHLCIDCKKKESRNNKYDKYNFTNTCECGNSKQIKSKSCESCYRIKQRKVNRPSLNDLLTDINELGFLGTGRKYGVSDNAIRKWIK